MGLAKCVFPFIATIEKAGRFQSFAVARVQMPGFAGRRWRWLREDRRFSPSARTGRGPHTNRVKSAYPQAGLQFLVFTPKFRIEMECERDVGRVILVGRRAEAIGFHPVASRNERFIVELNACDQGHAAIRCAPCVLNNSTKKEGKGRRLGSVPEFRCSVRQTAG